jgi:hypothetical protein
MMPDLRDLVLSAYEIAKRRGEQTDWDRFLEALKPFTFFRGSCDPPTDGYLVPDCIEVLGDGTEVNLSKPPSPTLRKLLNPNTGARIEFDEADRASVEDAILTILGRQPEPPTIDYGRSDIVPIMQTCGLHTATIYMISALPGQQLTAEEQAYNTAATLYAARLTAYLSMFPNLYAGAGQKPIEAKK